MKRRCSTSSARMTRVARRASPIIAKASTSAGSMPTPASQDTISVRRMTPERRSRRQARRGGGYGGLSPLRQPWRCRPRSSTQAKMKALVCWIKCLRNAAQNQWSPCPPRRPQSSSLPPRSNSTDPCPMHPQLSSALPPCRSTCHAPLERRHLTPRDAPRVAQGHTQVTQRNSSPCPMLQVSTAI